MAFNVNKARAQRMEARKEKVFEFEVDDEIFSLPLEIEREDYERLRNLPVGDVYGQLRIMMGDEAYDRLVTHSLLLNDVRDILKAHGEAVGVTPGES